MYDLGLAAKESPKVGGDVELLSVDAERTTALSARAFAAPPPHVTHVPRLQKAAN